MTSEGLGEMFEGEFGERCGDTFSIVLLERGGQTRQAYVDGERGPTSARATISVGFR